LPASPRRYGSANAGALGIPTNEKSVLDDCECVTKGPKGKAFGSADDQAKDPTTWPKTEA
jgi:hypothetical protein